MFIYLVLHGKTFVVAPMRFKHEAIEIKYSSVTLIILLLL